MDNQYSVKDGDRLICTLGSCESSLCVPVSHGNVIGGRNGAAICDCKPDENIKPFGICRGDGRDEACSPVILTNWLMGDKSVKLNGEDALLSTSILFCARGGIIRVKQS